MSKNETSSDFVMMAHSKLQLSQHLSRVLLFVWFKTNGIHLSRSDSILLLSSIEAILLIGMNRQLGNHIGVRCELLTTKIRCMIETIKTNAPNVLRSFRPSIDWRVEHKTMVSSR